MELTKPYVLWILGAAWVGVVCLSLFAGWRIADGMRATRRWWLREWRRGAEAYHTSRSSVEPLNRIEHDARYLVQKIARENAARHALLVLEGEGYAADSLRVRLYRQRVEAAVCFRDHATLLLRQSLGLPDHPTQIECAGWGEAP